MRKVTEKAAQALKDGRTYVSGNTAVIATGLTELTLYLHNNAIASYDYDSRTLKITDAGWQTATTKERLNGVLQVFGLPMYISQHNYEWLLHRRDTLVNTAWRGEIELEV